MNAITFIVFGFISYWIYFSIKKEGVLWIPKILLCIGGFVGFYWGITFFFSMLWEPFIKSTTVFGQLFKTGIVGLTYAMIYFPIAMATIYKWVEKIEEKIEERIGNKPYK